jgi:hypothetical protein
MSELAVALAKVQASLPKIAKNEKADTGKYVYTYASLADISEQVLPLLAKHGLSFACMPTLSEGGSFVLRYRLMHAEGEALEGEYPLPVQGGPQAQGSAITYARRYTLTALVGVAPEDDDGQAAQQAAVPAKKTAKKTSAKKVVADPADTHETLLSRVDDLIFQLKQHGVEHDPSKIAEYALQGTSEAQATIRRLTGMLPA